MRARYTWGLSFAAAMVMAASAGAQSSTSSTQSPAADESRTPATVQTAPAETTGTRADGESAGTVTVVGCVQKERDVLGTRGLGVGDEFVLTNVGKDASGSAAGEQEASASAADAAHGGIYTLTGDREDDLESMVGKRVEIVGRLEHHGGEMTSAASTSAPAGQAAGTSAQATTSADADAGENETVGTSGETETAGTSGAADAANEDDAQAPAANTGSTLGEDPAYEGTRSPEARAGIEAQRRAESLPRIEIASFREVGGGCEAPEQK